MTCAKIVKQLIKPARKQKKVNHNFSEWTEIILSNAHSMAYKQEDQFNKYEHEEIEYKNIEYESEIHAQKNSKKIDSDNVIVLVHPFYLFITLNSALSKSDKTVLNRYKRNMIKLLDSKESLNANVVLVETAYHYALASSTLLENHLVDAAFISTYNQGKISSSTNLNQLINKKIFFAGGYNMQCLCSAISQVCQMKESSLKNIFAINDLILNSPAKSPPNLSPDNMIYYRLRPEQEKIALPKNQVLKLDALFNYAKK